MTIYSGELDTEGAENRTVYDYQTGYGDRTATVAGEAAHDVLHGGAMGRVFETETAKLGGEGQRAMLAGFGVDTSGMDFPEPREVPITEARERIKSEGLEKHVKLPDGDTIKAPLLDIMVDRGKHRADYEQALARGPQGFVASALDVGTSLAVHMLDPVNLAASFVPVVGEARWASLMASAGSSAIARAGVRAGIGSVQGGAFAAAFEPLEWYADTQEGRDHTAMDALRNVFFGAALFGGLHVVGGGGADVARGFRGRPLYPFGAGEPRDKAQAAPPTPPSPARGEGAPALESAAAPRSFEPPADDEFLFVAQEAHPFQRAVADLPPTDQENLMQIAIAQVVRGDPVRVEEVLAAAAQHDPRIAESMAIAHKEPAVTGEPEIHADVLAQLRAAGMSEAEAETNAAIVAARYATRAARLGQTDAFALYRSEGLSIRGPGGDIADEPAAGRMFAQRGGPPDLFAEREQMGQENLPGTERIGEGELAQRRADQALKPKVAQKPMDEGLFADSAAQKTLFQSARQAPPFYSVLARAVTGAKQDKASPEQWLGMLKNTPGVKHEEMDWLGLADWLKAQNGAVTKQQVADYVRANSVEVREVHKGGPALEARARQLAEQENGAGSWDRIGGGGQEHYWRDARHEIGTKFGSYQLPGGENYRELLLTLPDNTGGNAARMNELERRLQNAGDYDTHEVEAYRREYKRLADDTRGKAFLGSHWDEPNVLAHIRFNDRTIDGKKTLFIEEIQSDWHQQGRRRGYQQPLSEKDRPQAIEKLHELEGQLNAMWSQRDTGEYAALKVEADTLRAKIVGSEGVPDAPFKTSWPELSLKRMIRYAAEHGYDQVAWTHGEAQAARYDLSKHIKRVEFHKSGYSGFTPRDEIEGRDSGTLIAIDHNGNKVMDKHISVAELPDHIGKDVAEKLMAQEGHYATRGGTAIISHKLEGLDLKVGGEGMLKFYDDILPAAANKVVKKFGAKVGEGDLKTGATSADELEIVHRGDHFDVIESDTGMFAERFDTREQAQAYITSEKPLWQPTQSKVHTLPLTAPLREAAVGEGFPLFQRGEAGPRGRIMLADNKAIVDLFRSADASTFMHEMSHKWLDEHIRDAASPNAGPGHKADLDVVLRWLGVEKAEDVGTAQHEQWARGFEQYLSEGAAPSARLAAAFERFKQWLAGIYRAIAGKDVPISDDVRGVMGRMLATDEEMAGRAGDTTSATPTPGPSSQGGGEPPAVHVAQKPKRGPAARPEETWSLFEFLAARGGLRPDPDLKAIVDKNPFVPGFGPLVRKTGMGLDRAREAAIEAGYFIEPGHVHGGVNEIGINHLLEAIDTESRGQRQYRVGNEPAEKGESRVDRLDAIERELHGALSDAGITVSAEPSARMKRVVEIMDREGVHDAAEAYERAIMEEDRHAIDDGRAKRHGPIEGWDLPDDGRAAPGAGGEPAPAGPARPGEGPRQRGGADRAQDAGAYRAIAEQRDSDAAARLAASKAAEREKEPGSIDSETAASPSPPSPASAGEGVQPQSKRTKAAVAEEAQAIAEFDAAVRAGYLTEAERLAVEDAIHAINDGEIDARMVAERGVACLTAAAGGAGA